MPAPCPPPAIAPMSAPVPAPTSPPPIARSAGLYGSAEAAVVSSNPAKITPEIADLLLICSSLLAARRPRDALPDRRIRSVHLRPNTAIFRDSAQHRRCSDGSRVYWGKYATTARANHPAPEIASRRSTKKRVVAADNIDRVLGGKPESISRRNEQRLGGPLPETPGRKFRRSPGHRHAHGLIQRRVGRPAGVELAGQPDRNHRGQSLISMPFSAATLPQCCFLGPASPSGTPALTTL